MQEIKIETKDNHRSGEEEYGLEHGREGDYSTAFDSSTQNKLFRIEEDSWWFQYRSKIIVNLMRRFFDQCIQTTDIGGGNGFTTSVAAKNGFSMQLLEPSEEACRNAKRRGINATCGVMTEDYPVDHSYHQVLLLDVLEHLEDDIGFLSLMHRKIVRGGILLITVPAFPCLWSSEDDVAGHFRRYRKKQINKILNNNGFDILYCNYFMCFLFIPVLILRVGFERLGLLKKHEERSEEEERTIMEAQFRTKRGLIGVVLNFFEQIEEKLLRISNIIPFGSSIIIVARSRQPKVQ